jgi:L-threonylcarbamoyladenylate synthase
LEGGGGFVDVLRPGGLGVEGIVTVLERVDGGPGKTEVRVHGKPWIRNAQASSSKLPSVMVKQERDKPQEVLAGPSTPGMKYRHYSPRVPVYLFLPSNIFPQSGTAEPDISSPWNVIGRLSADIPRKGGKLRIGILHYDHSPLAVNLLGAENEQVNIELVPLSLGADAKSAAQRIFAGLLTLEGRQGALDGTGVAGDAHGVDAIIVEGCSDAGLGLAVMERIGKAVGGGGHAGSLDVGQVEISGQAGRFWVKV